MLNMLIINYNELVTPIIQSFIRLRCLLFYEIPKH